MTKRINNKLRWMQVHNLAFLGVLIFGAVLLLGQFSVKLNLQILIIALMLYLIGAFIHHHNDKSLTFEVMIEYILLATLVLIIAQSFLI